MTMITTLQSAGTKPNQTQINTLKVQSNPQSWIWNPVDLRFFQDDNSDEEEFKQAGPSPESNSILECILSQKKFVQVEFQVGVEFDKKSILVFLLVHINLFDLDY